MNSFSISQFEKNQVNNEYQFKDNDGRIVKQTAIPKRKEYLEEIKDPRSPYSQVRIYYMESGSIKVAGDRFYLMPINVWKYYAQNGTITKETNWEAGFKFSLSDLIAKMKANYDLDLMKNNPLVDVERADDEEDGRKGYVVTFPASAPGVVNIVVIDGINGKETERTTSTVKH